MDRYYYLVSSLPLLKFGQAPGILRSDFIAEAAKWLSVQDFIILSGVNINNFLSDKKDTPCLLRWKEFDYSIRTELAAYRRARKQNTEQKIRKELSVIIQEDSDPLEIERRLLLLRWNFLEEEEREHFFDLDFLIIYYLKLQLLERLASFDKEKGKERFGVYSAVE